MSDAACLGGYRSCCFNPRSPSPGSVSDGSHTWDRIRSEFQSSLPVAGERVRAWRGRLEGQSRVSILAPRRRGACPSLSALAGACDWGFNPRSPSPGSVSNADDRAPQRRATVSILAPRRRGACPLTVSISTPPADVSILAPRRRGACPRVVSLLCSDNLQFQSSLPVAGERVLGPPPPPQQQQQVSILAPRRRGACPRYRPRRRRRSDGFNPRSPSPGSVSFAEELHHGGAAGFNPRSPSPGSVSCAGRRPVRTTRSFNPRSPSPGSVSTSGCNSMADSERFNPRSPSPGSVSPTPTAPPLTQRWFQSSLPVAGERVWDGLVESSASWVFQSSLPVAGERVHQAHQISRGRLAVSILAPRRRGACLAGKHAVLCDAVVSILAPRRRGACLKSTPRQTSWASSFNPRSPSPGSVSERRAVRAAG